MVLVGRIYCAREVVAGSFIFSKLYINIGQIERKRAITTF